MTVAGTTGLQTLTKRALNPQIGQGWRSSREFRESRRSFSSVYIYGLYRLSGSEMMDDRLVGRSMMAMRFQHRNETTKILFCARVGNPCVNAIVEDFRYVYYVCVIV